MRRQKLLRKFCESCGAVVQKKERKVAHICNKSLAGAKRGQLQAHMFLRHAGNDEYIDAGELQLMCRDLGRDLSDEELEALLVSIFTQAGHEIVASL